MKEVFVSINVLIDFYVDFSERFSM